jgi:hypothetical protein
MTKTFIVILGLIAIPLGSVAEAAVSVDSCRPFIPRNEFEARGGKLVMTRQPDMRFPKNISEICSGATGLGIIVLQDGSVLTDDFEHNHFSNSNKPSNDFLDFSNDTTGMCDALIERKVKKIRFSPPQLRGKSVCVRFYVDWSSSRPSELIPFGKFPR